MVTEMFVHFLWISASLALDREPLCLSRYDYDHKILTAIVELEKELKELKKELAAQSDILTAQAQEIEELHTSYKAQLGQRQRGLGSTYVRWGRTSCPQNGTETVYTGYAAGSHYSHSGAAVNYLCLPHDPLWGDFDVNSAYAYIYGAEYEMSTSFSKKFFKVDLDDNDVPCAVCRSPRTSLLMVPGRNACYDGWTVEYKGYLAAGYYGHVAASEYVCLDSDPEDIRGGQTDKDGKLFYLVESRCGSLPCPPYAEGRELTCVVCTV